MHITNTRLCCIGTVYGKKEAVLLLKLGTAFMLKDLGRSWSAVIVQQIIFQ
jgi:hypothetical protein